MGKASLVLEDGTFFTGESFGASGETIGEVVFNTCMTGYQEIITDPSYNGQIVSMTYPLIGNYGFNILDNESLKPHVQGFIVKELCTYSSNWRFTVSANDYFKNNNIIGVKGIDTRSLTKHIRQFGSMFSILSTESGNVDILKEKIELFKNIKRNLVMEVTTKTVIHKEGSGEKIVVLDCGVKNNIIRSLIKRNCDVYILPAFSSYEEILSFAPDGILISNGPGDPDDLPQVKLVTQRLLGVKPLLGICLGHQILGLALGEKTFKLKFGHHGGNHPVKDLVTNKCYITSQNHNYAIKKSDNTDITITHININDGTIEGFRHNKYPILSVQYHPEASPGPIESNYIFDEFLALINYGGIHAD